MGHPLGSHLTLFFFFLELTENVLPKIERKFDVIKRKTTASSAATIVVAVNKLNKCGFAFVKMLG